MEGHVELIEKLSLNAFPALKREELDGWILQYSKGYTYRANCICPLDHCDRDIIPKIKTCEKKYREMNIPVIFKITDYTESSLDSILDNIGYSIVKRVNLMSVKLNGYVRCDYTNIKISRTLDKEWLEAFVNLSGIKETRNQDIHVQMLKNIEADLICVRAVVANKIVGCGLGVIENNIVGLFDINVDTEYRKRGLATNICRGIINEAVDCDAQEAYLQVYKENKEAISVYNKLRFKILYKYWFRKQLDNVEIS